MPMEGSLLLVPLFGTRNSLHVFPASVETAPPWLEPQDLFGRYTVPSGATLIWPCRPPQSVSPVLAGTPGPNWRPPLSERWHMSGSSACEQ